MDWSGTVVRREKNVFIKGLNVDVPYPPNERGGPVTEVSVRKEE